MLPKTRKLLALREMGLATYEDIVAWAGCMLESGVDSKNICILASLSQPLYPSEVEDYFQRSFKDVGWTFPPGEEILHSYACDVARNIVTGSLSPIDGCREMFQIARALDFSHDMDNWVSLDDDLDRSTISIAEIEKAIQSEAKSLSKAARCN